jgi:phosphoglycerate kinase
LNNIQNVEVKGKRILLRVDFNMPQNKEGAITDDTKMVAALPTINHLLGQGARLIIMSHLGRPKGQANPKYSLRPMAEHLSKLLGQDVPLAPGCVEPEVEAMAQKLKDGEAILLENVRYYPERSATSTSTTPSAAPIAHTPQPRASRTTSPSPPLAC